MTREGILGLSIDIALRIIQPQGRFLTHVLVGKQVLSRFHNFYLGVHTHTHPWPRPTLICQTLTRGEYTGIIRMAMLVFPGPCNVYILPCCCWFFRIQSTISITSYTLPHSHLPNHTTLLESPAAATLIMSQVSI